MLALIVMESIEERWDSLSKQKEDLFAHSQLVIAKFKDVKVLMNHDAFENLRHETRVLCIWAQAIQEKENQLLKDFYEHSAAVLCNDVV